MKKFFNKYLPAIIGIIISGTCWYLSCDLTGDFWYLLWIAPISILHLSYRTGWRLTFLAAFTAYLLGRLSWAFYLLKVIPVMPAIVITLAISLVFALLTLWNRKLVLKYPRWWTVFIFPALWTAFEYLLITLSPDGSAGSIAFSQMNFHAIIQIASLIGILGITFLVILLPSALALTMHFQNQKALVRNVLLSSSILIFLALSFGFYRLSGKISSPVIKIGLACVKESEHEETGSPSSSVEKKVAASYSEQINLLALKNAQIIVLPEKILALTSDIDTAIMNILIKTAIANQVELIGSYTRIIGKIKENAGLIISPSGKLNTSYIKVNLFEGERYNGFRKGEEIGFVDLNYLKAGFAICKDLDYQDFIRKFDSSNVQVLFVPAWDFVQDGWLHSRMAIMQGIENGFSVVRCAREGRLTISDPFGRVTFEASSENENAVSLLGEIHPLKIKTLYNFIGDDFGVVNLLFAFLLFYLLLAKKPGQVKEIQ